MVFHLVARRVKTRDLSGNEFPRIFSKRNSPFRQTVQPPGQVPIPSIKISQLMLRLAWDADSSFMFQTDQSAAPITAGKRDEDPIC